MKAAEIQVLKDIVDKELPILLVAEVERLPAAYQSVINAILPIVSPLLIAALDAKIAALVPDPAP